MSDPRLKDLFVSRSELLAIDPENGKSVESVQHQAVACKFPRPVNDFSGRYSVDVLFVLGVDEKGVVTLGDAQDNVISDNSDDRSVFINKSGGETMFVPFESLKSIRTSAVDKLIEIQSGIQTRALGQVT